MNSKEVLYCTFQAWQYMHGRMQNFETGRRDVAIHMESVARTRENDAIHNGCNKMERMKYTGVL